MLLPFEADSDTGDHMIALELTDMKSFMNTLLKSDTFDHFLLQEAVINVAASYVIDGRINHDFFSEEELTELGLTGYPMLPFSMLRQHCFDLFKGRKMPSSFRFIFLLSPDNVARTLQSTQSSYTSNDISGIFINIRYQGGQLTLTTGISYRIFSTDKSFDAECDKIFRQFLLQHKIAFEEL